MAKATRNPCQLRIINCIGSKNSVICQPKAKGKASRSLRCSRVIDSRTSAGRATYHEIGYRLPGCMILCDSLEECVAEHAIHFGCSVEVLNAFVEGGLIDYPGIDR